MSETAEQTPATPPAPARAAFQRMEGFDMDMGRLVSYQLTTTGFVIVIHRHGVAFRGTVPIVQREGMESLINVFRRAVIQHEHLKASFEAGQQSYLTEDEITLRMAPKPLAFSEHKLDCQGNLITGP